MLRRLKSLIEEYSVKRQKHIFLILLLISLATVSTCLAQNNNETDTVQNGEAAVITAVQGIWFIGAFAGSIIRLMLPTGRKAADIKVEGWNHRYTGTTILTIVLALIVTGIAFPMAAIPEDFNSLFSLFWLAFGSGYGGNAALIEVSEYLT